MSGGDSIGPERANPYLVLFQQAPNLSFLRFDVVLHITELSTIFWTFGVADKIPDVVGHPIDFSSYGASDSFQSSRNSPKQL